MHHSPQHLSGFIDLLVEAVLRDLETEKKNADESGQEQRRREDQSSANVSRKTIAQQT